MRDNHVALKAALSLFDSDLFQDAWKRADLGFMQDTGEAYEAVKSAVEATRCQHEPASRDRLTSSPLRTRCAKCGTMYECNPQGEPISVVVGLALAKMFSSLAQCSASSTPSTSL